MPAMDVAEMPPAARFRRRGRYRSIALRKCENEREPIESSDWTVIKRRSVSTVTPSSIVSGSGHGGVFDGLVPRREISEEASGGLSE